MPVDIDRRTRDRADLVDDLLPVFQPGGEPHQQQAAGPGVGERRNVLEQLLRPVRAVKGVDVPLHVEPYALGKSDELLRLACMDRLAYGVKTARWHDTSIGERRATAPELLPAEGHMLFAASGTSGPCRGLSWLVRAQIYLACTCRGPAVPTPWTSCGGMQTGLPR